jgi:hypothetical protein
MTVRRSVSVLLSLPLLCLALIASWGFPSRAGDQARGAPQVAQGPLDDVRRDLDKLAAEHRKLADQHLALRKDYQDLLAKHETFAQQTDKNVTDLKAALVKEIDAARKYNLRIEWRTGEVGITPPQGEVREVNFGRRVVEAQAFLVGSELQYKPGVDHNVEKIRLGVVLEGAPAGNVVKVRAFNFMHDDHGNNGDHYSRNGKLSFVVIARVE